MHAPAVGTINSFTSSQHRTNLPSYQELAYRGLWPGIDLVYTGEPSRLKYEVRMAPGADPSRIRFRWRGAEPHVSADRRLQLNTAAGDLVDVLGHRPYLRFFPFGGRGGGCSSSGNPISR